MEEIAGRKVYAVFPTPVMVVSSFIQKSECDEMIAYFDQLASSPNRFSERTCHTAQVDRKTEGACGRAIRQLVPHLVAFGSMMFGEELEWDIKEAWLNRMLKGGFLSLHNHANTLASGVLYLTDTDESARTIFHKQIGTGGFTFINDHDGVTLNKFTATYWTTPAMSAGDLVIFPSNMIHEVPLNEGETRYSMAFNAIPDRLRTGIFSIRFDGA